MYGCLSVLHYNPYFRCLQPVYYTLEPSTLISLKLHSNGSRLKRVLNSFLKAANRSLLFLPLFPNPSSVVIIFLFLSFSLSLFLFLSHSLCSLHYLFVRIVSSLSLFSMFISHHLGNLSFSFLSHSPTCLSLFYLSALASRFFLNFLPHRRVIFSR